MVGLGPHRRGGGGGQWTGGEEEEDREERKNDLATDLRSNSSKICVRKDHVFTWVRDTHFPNLIIDNEFVPKLIIDNEFVWHHYSILISYRRASRVKLTVPAKIVLVYRMFYTVFLHDCRFLGSFC